MNNFKYSDFPSDNECYVFMVRSYGFLARCIRFFMWLKQKALNKSTKDIVNHADLYLGYGTVIGAIKEGVFPKSVSGMYNDEKRRKIYIYRVPIDILSLVTLRTWSMDQAGKKYEISNFFNQMYRILYIVFKGKEKWLGHRGINAQKRYFCSEFVSTALSQIIPNFSLSPWDDDPMDLKELCDSKFSYVKTIEM